MGLFQRFLPDSVQLAITAAAEHFTSVLAEQILEDDSFADQDLPEHVKDLFRWHALEECEHQAVAYDVYDQCVGSEVTRLATMQALTAPPAAFAPTPLSARLTTDPPPRTPPP